MIFVKAQKNILEHEFKDNQDRTFADRYEACKGICVDTKFEKFYQELMDNDKKCCH